MVEVPSRVLEGPEVAVEALVEAMETVLGVTERPPLRRAGRRAGHARSGERERRDLVQGATNFNQAEW